MSLNLLMYTLGLVAERSGHVDSYCILFRPHSWYSYGTFKFACNAAINIIIAIGAIIFGKPIAEMFIDRKLNQANSMMKSAISCKEWLDKQK